MNNPQGKRAVYTQEFVKMTKALKPYGFRALRYGGRYRIRTCDPLHVKSYGYFFLIFFLVFIGFRSIPFAFQNFPLAGFPRFPRLSATVCEVNSFRHQRCKRTWLFSPLWFLVHCYQREVDTPYRGSLDTIRTTLPQLPWNSQTDFPRGFRYRCYTQDCCNFFIAGGLLFPEHHEVFLQKFDIVCCVVIAPRFIIHRFQNTLRIVTIELSFMLNTFIQLSWAVYKSETCNWAMKAYRSFLYGTLAEGTTFEAGSV